MSHPWYAFYPNDYRGKTNGLTMLQDGAYRRLIDEYYATSKPLPANAEILLRICRAFADDEKAAVLHVVGLYFEKRADGWHHRRIDKEIEKRGEISQKRAVSGLKGAQKTNGKCRNFADPAKRQMPTQLQSHSQLQSDTQKENSIRSLAFADFWSTYPKKVGKGAAEKAWRKASAAATVDMIMEALNRSLPSMKGQDIQYVPNPATWLNQRRWEDEGPKSNGDVRSALPQSPEERARYCRVLIEGYGEEEGLRRIREYGLEDAHETAH